jgi:hypothetical protein
MILIPNGKYYFFSFSSLSFCKRVEELSKHFTQCTSTTTPTNLKSVCLFMEKCFNETSMDETERRKISFFVFSRHPVTEFEDIFKKGVFEMKL